jgi:hypothetical protein
MACVLYFNNIHSIAFDDACPKETRCDDSFSSDDTWEIYHEKTVFLDKLSSHCLPDQFLFDNSESSSSLRGESTFNGSVSSFESFFFEDVINISTEIKSVNVGFNPNANSFVPKRKRVSFGSVTVREYNVVMGCQDIACPLELGWKYQQDSFPDYESYQSQPRTHVRCLSYAERREMLSSSQNMPDSDVKFSEQEMLAMQTISIQSKIPVINEVETDETIKRKFPVDLPPRLPRAKSKTTTVNDIDVTYHQYHRYRYR